MKVLILVLSMDIEPYISLTNTIKETWASYKIPEIDIYFYYGKSEKISDSNNIFFNVEEGLYNIGYKTLEMFEYIKDFDFDFVFRTNSSSYVNQENLIKFLLDKPKTNFYCGHTACVNFASGSGYILSSDLIKKIIDNKKMWNHSMTDDSAIGNLLHLLNVPLSNSMKRLDIYKEYGTLDMEFSVFPSIYPNNITDFFHFRCKHSQKIPWISDDNRDRDINVMKKLYEIFKNN